MSENRYSIVMQTPLGKKHGTLTADVTQDTLTGSLNIFGHEEPLEGTVDSAGNCTVTGVFTTLVRTVPFVATGKITGSSVTLQIHEDRNVFELTGVSCEKEREKQV
ncbi:MAG: hypothetical protein ACI4HL_00455 [Ruminococcus sp.]